MLRKETRVLRRGRKPQKASLKLRRSPHQARAAETVAVILEAATQILESRGMSGFNTNAVAERAGVSIGSLYQYFPGKEAILAALHKSYKERLIEAVEVALARTEGEELLVRLRALVSAQIDAHSQSPSLHRILEAEEERTLGEGDLGFNIRLHKCVAQLLREGNVQIPKISLNAAAADLCVISGALTDAALANSKGRITANYKRRILRAVEGYLLAETMSSAYVQQLRYDPGRDVGPWR